MEEILQDINEFNTSGFIVAIINCSMFLIGAYILKTPTNTWWQHWKALAVFFIIFWLILSRITMERPFVKQEDFKSLIKIEGVFHYTDEDVFFIVPPYTSKKFPVDIKLCTNNWEDISKYENQYVEVWQKNHVIYQFECNENVIYSLKRSNEKVWLGVIWDLLWNYVTLFCFLLMMYFGTIRAIKNFGDGLYD